MPPRYQGWDIRTTWLDQAPGIHPHQWGVKADGGGAEGGGAGAGSWGERSDAVHLEVEVRGDGSERGAAATGLGGGEPAPEATGGGSEPGPGSAGGGDRK